MGYFSAEHWRTFVGISTGNRLTQNYETEAQFIREYFEPQRKGHAPTYRKIEIDKNKDLLIFEDIDE